MLGFHGGSNSKESTCNAGDLPGEFHGQRSLLSYSLQGCKDMTELLTHTHKQRLAHGPLGTKG